MKWLLERIFGTSAEAKEINAKKAILSADLVHPGNNGEMKVVGSGDETNIFALNTVIDELDSLDPNADLSTVSASDQLLVSDADSRAPAPAFDNTIIEPNINLVDSIFKQDAEKDNLKYFFSIFIPPADSEDNKKKSIASTPSSDPILSSKQQTELREALQKCASTYFSGDTDLTLSDSSDPQSGSTKTTSKSSQISKEKAQPPVYFGVGIKTELAEDGDEKFLKITEIFNNSNLRKEKQGNEDYTNQFITHLNCKLNDGEEAKDHSITDIFNKFKGHPNPKEKFDEKIDKIFRDLKETSIKFKISKNTSQTDSTTQLAEVTVNKIIFEKTNGVYRQKKMTPSPITEIRDATGKGVAAGLAGVAV